jgi:hypothetical protein
MTTLLRKLILGATLVTAMAASGCYIEHGHRHGYYGRYEPYCRGHECREHHRF